MTIKMKTAAASAVLAALLTTAALAQNGATKAPEMKHDEGHMSGEMNADGMSGMQGMMKMMTMMEKMGPMMESCTEMMQAMAKPSGENPATERKG